MRRQRIRKALIIISLLLFPATINYFSPYIIIDGASHGIVNGGFITFALLFLVSLFLGRIFCSWICPGAGLQECLFMVRNKRAPGGRCDWIKYFIWVPWFSAVAVMAVLAGGYHAINPLHLTEEVVSVAEPMAYINYYFIVSIFVILSLTCGKRAFCHYVCWMAPFMIVGRRIRNLVSWPSLRLKPDRSKCISCMTCSQNCPMSLNVEGMVQKGLMENRECILCGTCVVGCPQGVIRYAFSSGVGQLEQLGSTGVESSEFRVEGSTSKIHENG
ncbi:MAG: 4Fe-4S binding protein [bacterium]